MVIERVFLDWLEPPLAVAAEFLHERYASGGSLDLGDIIAAAGPLERTRTGEITIWVDRLTLLSKSIVMDCNT